MSSAAQSQGASAWKGVALGAGGIVLVFGGSPRTTDVRNGRAERDPRSAGAAMLGRVPAAFVPNLGQWEHPASFVARMAGATVFLEEAGFTVNLPECAEESARGAAVRMRFEGARAAEIVGEERLVGVHNYFLGSDPSRWRTDVPRFGAVRHRDLY